jgi:plastocyanin
MAALLAALRILTIKNTIGGRISLHFMGLSIAVTVLLAIAPAVGRAAEHLVKMLNDNGKGEYMVFEPSFIEAAPGDTVKFVAVDQFHNAETMPEIWPEGAATFQGELSKDVTLTSRSQAFMGSSAHRTTPWA